MELPQEESHNHNDDEVSSFSRLNLLHILWSLKEQFFKSFLNPNRKFPKVYESQFVPLPRQEHDYFTINRINSALVFKLPSPVIAPQPVICVTISPVKKIKSPPKPAKAIVGTRQHSTQTYTLLSASETSNDRKQSKIFHLRSFNNWIKNMLLSEYVKKVTINQKVGQPVRVLDMCCGKGGDLLKYYQQKISHLICTDISAEYLNECKSRYNKLTVAKQSCYSAEFIVCDSTRASLRKRYKSPWVEHQLVCCQFSLQFSFQSLPQADCMIRNASECLQAGGFLMATIPNANEIMRRLKKAKDRRSFGNEFYNIRFEGNTRQPPLFNAKYKMHLEGCQEYSEYLVHFPTLVKLCRRHGLKLERVNTFADYFDAAFDKGKLLLQKTKALETVCVNGDSKLEKRFSHVEEYDNGIGLNYFGTLSQPEWEVASLYLVCAFKKCETSWDKELNPIYHFDS